MVSLSPDKGGLIYQGWPVIGVLNQLLLLEFLIIQEEAGVSSNMTPPQFNFYHNKTNFTSAGFDMNNGLHHHSKGPIIFSHYAE